VVANLPYYAANPIIRRFLESQPRPKLLVVMVQKEVARAMLAKPGEMSLLSVATQYYAEPVLVCNVPPRSFRPPPKVTSSVVRLVPRPRPAVDVSDERAFFNLVRAGFAAPRKQLRNSLGQGLGIPPAQVGQILADLALDGSRRAETLTLDEWALIFGVWEELSKVGSSCLR
jgi:16S rRNA (adenine1518-N6/adenine1519-N6)-dimethyltransferase